MNFGQGEHFITPYLTTATTTTTATTKTDIMAINYLNHPVLTD